MNRWKKGLLVTLGVAIAFAVGFGWQYLRAERLERRVGELERDLTFQTLATELGIAAVEANRSSYESARRMASEFFTGLQASIDQAPTEVKGELSSILARRDDVITDLSRSVPASADTLADFLIRFHLAWSAVRNGAAHGAGDTVGAHAQ
jgi:hypothetical protein